MSRLLVIAIPAGDEDEVLDVTITLADSDGVRVIRADHTKRLEPHVVA